jgi:hypothetical protein
MRTRANRFRLIAILAAIALCLAIYYFFVRGGATTNFGEAIPILARLPDKQMPVIYEGLPHHFYERDVLEKELKTKPNFRILGYPFYTTPLKLSDQDLAEVASLVRTESSFRPWRGYKTCGGFHPDNALEWTVGSMKFQILICFGCSEVKIHDGRWIVWCDIDNQPYDRLKVLLRKYRTNRPPLAPEPVLR